MSAANAGSPGARAGEPARQADSSEPMSKIFFYGLFMDRSLLTEKGLHPEMIGPALLPGYRIHIGERATLLRSAASRAYGIVMELSDREARALYSEASVREYVRERVQVELLDTGEAVQAYCYNLPRELGLTGANPAYATRLSQLVEALQFDPAYAEEIAAFGEAAKPVKSVAIIDNEMLWRQFGAAIDMFGDAVRGCPDELWEVHLWEDQPDQWVAAGFPAFWYLCYHTLFWLDLYLTGAEEGFAPPEPFDLVEMEPDEALPRTYTRAELLGYLEYCRRKCQETSTAMSSEQAQRLCRFAWGELPFAELQLYNLRHVQEHGAQLHLFLGQQAGKSAGWVSRADK